jgi:hypothetical protein
MVWQVLEDARAALGEANSATVANEGHATSNAEALGLARRTLSD